MHYILDIITHDVFRTIIYTLLITRLVQYSFSIKLHPKQKYFDGLCIYSGIDKKADLPPFRHLNFPR